MRLGLPEPPEVFLLAAVSGTCIATSGDVFLDEFLVGLFVVRTCEIPTAAPATERLLPAALPLLDDAATFAVSSLSELDPPASISSSEKMSIIVAAPPTSAGNVAVAMGNLKPVDVRYSNSTILQICKGLPT